MITSKQLKKKRAQRLLVGSAIIVAISLAGVAVYWSKNGRSLSAQSRPMAMASVPKPDDLDAWNKHIATAGVGDYAELMRRALAIDDAGLRNAVLTSLVSKWLSTDPQSFTAFLDKAEIEGSFDGNIWKLLSPAFEKVLPSLKEKYATSPDLKNILRRFIAFSAKTDPAKALTWVRQWITGDALYSSLATISIEFARTSPDKAFAVLETITAPGRRVDALTGIGAVLAVTHPDQALAWATTLPASVERPYAMGSVLSALAKKSPDRAATEFLKFQKTISDEYVAQLAADAISTGNDQSNLSPNDPGDAEVLPSRDNPQLHLLKDAGVTIARQWAATDPIAAMKWLDSLPASSMKEDASQAALGSWAKTDPQAALAYYTSKEITTSAPVVQIFDTWASSHPSEAAAAATALQNPDQRNAAVSGVVTGWIENGGQSVALQAWIDKLPAGDSRDLANYQLVDVISVDQPELAWQRAITIDDAATRVEAMKSAFASWVERNPDAAREALKAVAKQGDDLSALKTMLEAVTPQLAGQ